MPLGPAAHLLADLREFVALLMTGSHVRPARLRYMDALLGTLGDALFDAETTYPIYLLLDGYILGFSLWEIAYTTIPFDVEVVLKLMQTIPWDAYPQLAAHRDQHMSDGPHHEVSAFEVGLDLILAGLQKRRASPSS